MNIEIQGLKDLIELSEKLQAILTELQEVKDKVRATELTVSVKESA